MTRISFDENLVRISFDAVAAQLQYKFVEKSEKEKLWLQRISYNAVISHLTLLQHKLSLKSPKIFEMRQLKSISYFKESWFVRDNLNFSKLIVTL